MVSFNPFNGFRKKNEAKANREADNAIRLVEVSDASPSHSIELLGCSPRGHTPAQAAQLLSSHHPNVIITTKPPAWYLLLWRAIVHPFNILLFTLAIVSIATGDSTTFTILIVMVALSVLLRWSQELKSVMDAESIRKMLKTTVHAVRTGEESPSPSSLRIPSPEIARFWNDHITEILLENVVPGDIVKLSVGDIVPADCRLIVMNNLMINQSALTGESMPVEKTLIHVDEPKSPSVFVRSPEGEHVSPHAVALDIGDDDGGNEKRKGKVHEPTEHEALISRSMNRKNLCFMGTTVASGSGFAVVVFTGKDSYLASNAELLMMERPATAFDKGVKRVAFLLMAFMVVMVPLVIIINGVTTKGWENAALFGISVAVGLTPEMLPMIVNGNLARAARVMSKRKCIVKRIQSLQNVGAMDILCTDKTGTLTEDHIVLNEFVDSEERKATNILMSSFLVSKLQTGFTNPMDDAIVNAYTSMYSNHEMIVNQHVKVDEFPFDFVKRRMSVIVEETQTATGDDVTEAEKSAPVYLICKGAVDEVMALCSKMNTNAITGAVPAGATSLSTLGAPVSMSAQDREKIIGITRRMNAEGLRVLVVAYRSITAEECKERDKAERDLTFLGLLAFQDPPKVSAALAIRRLRERGVTIKVLTGDNHIVAEAVCEQVGLATDAEQKKRKLVVMTGSDMEGVHPDEMPSVVERVDVFARLTPGQKAQVVATLKDHNHTVGFLGDGVNDALALKQADVGVSVDTGSDLAKDAADIILLEKDLGVIVEAVDEGRRTHGNTIKYIMMAASSNFGNVFSVLIAAAWLPFLPMLPVQLLAQNLLYDISQISIPWDNMDEEYLRTPKQWSASNLWRFMVFIGPTSSCFDMTTFCLMWFYYGLQTPAQQVLFQSAWFTEGLVTQTLIVHMIRTHKIPFFQSIASWPVLLCTSIIIILAIAIPFTALGTDLGMAGLPGIYYVYLLGANLGYCVLVNISKNIYIRLFGVWLG